MTPPRYPEVFVNVADGVSLATILERVDAAMRMAGVSTARRHEFKGGVPHGYALAVNYVRQWVVPSNVGAGSSPSRGSAVRLNEVVASGGADEACGQELFDESIGHTFDPVR
jgi:hypothetical protein